MRRYVISVSLPGSLQAHRFTLRGSRRAILAHQAAVILVAFARSRGVSVYAVDYNVTA